MRIVAQIIGVHPNLIDAGDHRFRRYVVGAWELEIAAIEIEGEIEEAQRHLREGTRFQLVPIDQP